MQKEIDSSIDLKEMLDSLFNEFPFLKQAFVWLILDIDECIFNSVDKHYDWLIEKGKELGWEDMPTRDEFYEAGGTHKAFGHYPGYWEINAEMIASIDFNSGLEAIDGSVEAINALSNQFLFYLTARPDTLKELTEKELEAAGFPERPVICRPEDVPLEDTSEWKYRVLLETALEQLKQDEASKTNSRFVFMLDDSVGLNKLIKAVSNGEKDLTEFGFTTEEKEKLIKVIRRVESILFKGAITSVNEQSFTWKEIIELFSPKEITLLLQSF